MRRVTAWLGLAALVFAQLAIPVHACPMRAAEHEAMTMPCDETTAPSGMCHAHGQQDAQAVDKVSANASFDAYAPSFVTTVPVARAMPAISRIARAKAANAAAPPLYLRNCSLRF